MIDNHEELSLSGRAAVLHNFRVVFVCVAFETRCKLHPHVMNLDQKGNHVGLLVEFVVVSRSLEYSSMSYYMFISALSPCLAPVDVSSFFAPHRLDRYLAEGTLEGTLTCYLDYLS